MRAGQEHVGRAAGKEKEMTVIVICMETGSRSIYSEIRKVIPGPANKGVCLLK